jgi:hypothetical protein
VCRSRVDFVLGEVPFHDQDLATSAKRPATTNRIHVHAERTRGLEQGSSDRKSAALS